MATRRPRSTIPDPFAEPTTAPTSAPTPGPTTAPVAEESPSKTAPGAVSPAKLSKLQAAMNKVSDSITAIQALGADIDELDRTGGPKIIFAVDTSEGYKQADDVRFKARKLRLTVKGMKEDATKLLNGLKAETWAVMDPTIDRLDAIETNAKDQLAAHDRKEQDRKARHQDAIDAITVLGMQPPHESAEVRKRLDSLNAIIVDDSYEEFQERASKALEEVRATLTHALEVAEREERAEAERKADEALAAARRTRIANMKALPSQVEGTDLDNVRIVLRLHKADAPTAEEFGDMLDFAEAVHFKATKELEELELMLVMAEEHEREEAAAAPPPPPETDMEPSDKLDPTPAAADPPVATETFTIANDSRRGGEPQTIAITIPARRLSPRPVVSLPVVEDPRQSLDMTVTETEVPDLLKAAQDFITTAEQEGGYVFPVPMDAAYAALKAAVDFITEFAD